MSKQLWKVASDINDTHAPHNVYEEFYLEGPEINLEPTDRLREPGPLTAIAEALNAAPLLKEQNERMRKALIAITSNPYISLGDLVYQVRDREGKGWEGEAVKQWSDACVEIKKLTESLNP